MSLESGEGGDNLRFTKHFLNAALLGADYNHWNEMRGRNREVMIARLEEPKMFKGMLSVGAGVSQGIFSPLELPSMVPDLLFVGAELGDIERVRNFRERIKDQLAKIDIYARRAEPKGEGVLLHRDLLGTRAFMDTIVGICEGGIDLRFKEPEKQVNVVDLKVFTEYINSFPEPPI